MGEVALGAAGRSQLSLPCVKREMKPIRRRAALVEPPKAGLLITGWFARNPKPVHGPSPASRSGRTTKSTFDAKFPIPAGFFRKDIHGAKWLFSSYLQTSKRAARAVYIYYIGT
ncbi:MAG: hypothetical protein JST16_07755 [Bdellovibrionales bacterium]|nr:hypothetical protein [Bdellovibrionales bacterium]